MDPIKNPFSPGAGSPPPELVLFALRERLGLEIFPKPPLDYLNDWAATDKGWLRKFYRQGSDEPYFDLTPSAEKAIAWLGTLIERSFVGTESRLLTLFELLKQMSEGSETDPQARITELHKRRDEIDAEIARVLAGDIPLLGDTALKDRFQQFIQLARELLTDFREVEQNFRGLDRRVRERIALWEGGKGALLEEIMGERDLILRGQVPAGETDHRTVPRPGRTVRTGPPLDCKGHRRAQLVHVCRQRALARGQQRT